MTQDNASSRLLIDGSRGRYPRHTAKRVYTYVTRRDVMFGDETGTHGHAEYVIVGGYVSSPRQWDKFDRQWREILARHCVPAFHAKDFFPGAVKWDSASASPYCGWSDRKATAFLGELVDAINWHRVVPVGAAVNVADFKAQPLEVRQYVTGGVLQTRYKDGNTRTRIKGSGVPTRPPYMAALTVLVADALIHARHDSLVDFFLDENTDNEHLAKEMFKRIHERKMRPVVPENDRIGDLTYAPDERHPGIQAADLYCYMWNVALSRKHPNALHRVAWEPLRAKRDELPVLDAPAFREYVQRANALIRGEIERVDGETED